MKLPLWVNPQNWRLLSERNWWREWLALRLWHELPTNERHSDNKSVLHELAKQVDDFSCNPDADLSGDKLRAVQRLRHLDAALQKQVSYAEDNGALPHAISECRQLRKQLIRETKFLQLPIRQLSNLLPLLTAFFFLSGYFIITMYFGALGISVARFFSLTDYISSAMNGFNYLMSSLAISFLILIWVFRSVKLKMLRQQLGIVHRNDLLQWGLGLVLLLLFLGAASLPATWQFSISSALLLHIVGFILPKIAVRFERPLRALFLMSFLSLYSAMIASLMVQTVNFARSPFGDVSIEPIYQVELDDVQAASTYRFLAGNSNWMFLQEPTLRVQIVPIQHIKRMTRLQPDMLKQVDATSEASPANKTDAP